MLVKTIVVGSLATNCYLVAAKKGGNALVIDPGEDAPEIIKALDEDKLKVSAILLTHGHFDHTQGSWDLKEQKGGEIYCHPAESLPGTDHPLAEGQEFDVDGLRFKVMLTPGHSRGSCAFVTDEAIFSGDLIFDGGVGRTDFPGGSVDDLMKSLEKLKKLPDETKVYPGHGPSSTVGQQKEENPFMRLGAKVIE